jgi:hypothetical protein
MKAHTLSLDQFLLVKGTEKQVDHPRHGRNLISLNEKGYKLMAIKFVDKHMRGVMAILQSVEGDFLSCGRIVSGEIVFDTFAQALGHMNALIESNRQAFRKVQLAAVVEYEGIVSCGVHVPDDDRRRRTYGNPDLL